MKINKIIFSAVAIALLMIGCNKSEISETSTPAMKAGWDFFEPDKEYKFYSLNSQDSNELIELVVVYDVNGNATVDRNILPVSGEELLETHIFGENYSVDEVTNSINLNSSDFYLIDFDDVKGLINDPTTIIINCFCAIGVVGATCSPIYKDSGGVMTVTCVANAGCGTCGKTITIERNIDDPYIDEVYGGALIIEAVSLQYNQ